MRKVLLRSLMVIVLVSVVALAWGQNDKKLGPIRILGTLDFSGDAGNIGARV